MSKTFEKVRMECGVSDETCGVGKYHTKEYLFGKAMEKATEKRVLDEVIEIIRNHTEKEIETPEYDGVDCAIQELKQKYGKEKK